MGLLPNRPWHFTNENGNKTITSFERLNQPAELDLGFETCVVQATVVEALLLMLIHSLATHSLESKREIIVRKLDTITFHALISRAKKHDLLSAELIQKLRAYSTNRDILVHHHLVANRDFDYQVFLKDGETLLDRLYESTRDSVRRKFIALGESVATLWE